MTAVSAAGGQSADMDKLIAREDVELVVTKAGYTKRIKRDALGPLAGGVSGGTVAACSTHDWALTFTSAGRCYRAKVYELPEAGAHGLGEDLRRLLDLPPDETIAGVVTFRDYSADLYVVLAAKSGLIKKTELREYATMRAGGIVGINLREDDELVGVAVVSEGDDLVLVTAHGRIFTIATDDDLLPVMGRAMSGVVLVPVVDGDELVAMTVLRSGADA